MWGFFEVMSNFLKSGIKYSLMVDWNGRLSREIPFLSQVLNVYGITSGCLLDVGCGPGKHAEELSKKGYTVTAFDEKADMLNEIDNREIEKIAGDFLNGEKLKGRQFNAAYSLGNTVGLMGSKSSYEKILKRFSEVIRPGGLLVFQTLNFQKERNSWSKPRSARTEEGEYIFLRNFSTTDKFFRPMILTLFRESTSKKWQLDAETSVYIPRISSRAMRKIIKKGGFKDIKLYGSYLKETFEKDKSVDMIWTARKKAI